VKTSHIIYKVDDLYQAVKGFKNKGFEVEDGARKNPYNAIIYFSEGPYLELLASTGMPRFMKSMLRIFGKSKLVNRLDYWDNHKRGPYGVALENYKADLREELILIIKELCDDPVLTLFKGNGIKDLEFEYAVKEI
jgi:hypothetical protein